MKKIIEFAPAKINLFLEVGESRPDGYHEIDSIMQTVRLSDKIIVKYDGDRLSDSEQYGITVTSNNRFLTNDNKNIAYKAAEAFFLETGECGAVNIHLIKHIPIGAGLGGGSADAAAVLRALNKSIKAPIPNEQLKKIAASLGADVPFCLQGGTCRARGIGDILTKIPKTERHFVVVTTNGENVNTKWAYERFDEFRAENPRPRRSADEMVKKITERNPDFFEERYNAFEEVILPLRKKAVELHKTLTSLGGKVLMSGSGAAVYALFSTRKEADSVTNYIRTAIPNAFSITAEFIN